MQLRIATRASKMALAQAEFVKQALQTHYPDLTIELLPMTTEGDQKSSVMLSKVGGKGLFLKELEHALLSHEADLAVHSLKDMTAHLPEGLVLAAYCERTEVRDALVCSDPELSFETLPAQSVIGTASLRRTCLINALRSDLVIKPIRGNVQTRLKKLDAGEFDALILSAAGLERVDLSERITEYLSVKTFVPAVGQGAIVIECREDDVTTLDYVKVLDHYQTRQIALAERAFNQYLNGGCHVPIAGYANYQDNELILEGLVGQLDGQVILRDTEKGSDNDPETIGKTLAERLLSQGADRILQAI